MWRVLAGEDHNSEIEGCLGLAPDRRLQLIPFDACDNLAVKPILAIGPPERAKGSIELSKPPEIPVPLHHWHSEDDVITDDVDGFG